MNCCGATVKMGVPSRGTAGSQQVIHEMSGLKSAIASFVRAHFWSAAVSG
jgi:hypothetical protein